jgi:hypothetical protein
MQIKLNKREVELFYAGLLLGKTLDVDQEYSTRDCVGFGDFEGMLIRLCKKTLTLDFGHTDCREKYFASIGIVYEAQKEVDEWLGRDE